MMVVPITQFCLYAALFSLAASMKTGNGSLHTFGWDTTKRVMVFGDSYSTIGRQASNGAFFSKVASTWTNGPCWVNYLTTTFSETKILSLRDFASPGATIDDELVPSAGTSLKDQVAQFRKLLVPPPADLPWTSDSTLFASFIGINDILRSYELVDQVGLHQKELRVWRHLQDRLYASGARHFLHINVPPLQRTPRYHGNATASNHLLYAIRDYNSQLYYNSIQFQRGHPDAVVLFFDAYTSFSQILDNAHGHGFKNVTTFCPEYTRSSPSNAFNHKHCVNSVSHYAWLDAIHPTTAFHEAFAKAIKHFLHDPLPVYQLNKAVVAPPLPFLPTFTDQTHSWSWFNKVFTPSHEEAKRKKRHHAKKRSPLD